jgi:hypothetical protein
MGFRFRKTIRILPGIRLNLSKTGVSTSFGGRGLTTTIGHGKRRTTVGIPGTGMSYTTEAPLRSRKGAWVTTLAIVGALFVFFVIATA